MFILQLSNAFYSHLFDSSNGNLRQVSSLSNHRWAPSSEFVSSSIPSWQISTAHAQPFRGARDLAFFLKVPLDSLLVWASSKGSGETARMRRLAWTFAARICDKYQIRLTRSRWQSCEKFWPLFFRLKHCLCRVRLIMLLYCSLKSEFVYLYVTQLLRKRTGFNVYFPCADLDLPCSTDETTTCFEPERLTVSSQLFIFFANSMQKLLCNKDNHAPKIQNVSMCIYELTNW